MFRDKFLRHRDYACHLVINIVRGEYYSVPFFLFYFITNIVEQGNAKKGPVVRKMHTIW